VHRRGFPHVSLLALGAAAICFCFFSLADVIAALVVLRILLQFLMQHVGVIYLRRTQPKMKRPFRTWLYPLPPLLAIAGFTYMVFARIHLAGFREVVGAALVVALGTGAYVTRERLSVRRERDQGGGSL
jgi:amino acid transporter